MSKHTICVVGLGYVGLPLAYAFAKKGYKVYGYDVNTERIRSLKEGDDQTGELSEDQLKEVVMELSDQSDVIAKGNIVIMALPTPVDENKKPDLTLLKNASKTVGEHLQKGSIVVYESTVYPGTTEEICGPIIEETSGLKLGEDFMLGYSPERINPGDKEHTVFKIIKVVAGQDKETTDTLCKLYESIIEAGVHTAPSIKVAEMAKAIENAQRDLNIAFVNEVAILCHKIGINTQDVLEAARTKWNFLPFEPGLVGGHCIGVDPYYLVEKAKQLGMETQVITAGRAINDNMSKIIVDETIEAMDIEPKNARVLVLGLTFKPDIPDTRNSKSFDVIKELEKQGCTVETHDPQINEEAWKHFGFTKGSIENGPYDAILLLVPHTYYRDAKTEQYCEALKENGVIYDLKSVLDREVIEKSGKTYLSL